MSVAVAAYQMPLLPCGSTTAALQLIREQVRSCEAEGIDILCCPEAILGGLADDAPRPADLALRVDNGELSATLAPLRSGTVTTIVGFTEISPAGHLYNSAAVLHKGDVVGVYRKQHPAIRKSISHAGNESLAFSVGGLTFGILICNDSNFPDLAMTMVSRGAAVLFIPSNNRLPLEKADVVEEARAVDVARATDHAVWVVRADVAGHAGDRVSYGATAIVAPGGTVRQSATRLAADLLKAELTT